MKIGKQKLKSEVIKQKKKPAKPEKKAAPSKSAKTTKKTKKAKKSKLKLILPLILILAVAGGAFAFIHHKGSKEDQANDLQMEANIDEQKDSDEKEDKEDKKDDKKEDKKSKDKDSQKDEGKSDEGDDENTEDTESEEETENPISVSDAVNFMQTLSPQLLGLSGSSMAQYKVYPSMSVVLVDGMECSELSVYSQGKESGTNDIEGIYLLSRGELRHLYRLDKKTEQVTEIPLSDMQSTALDDLGSELSPEQSAALDEAIKNYESENAD